MEIQRAYLLLVAEGEVITSSYSLSRVNIVSLARKFSVYLHFAPLFTSGREHINFASDKASFYKT